MKIRLKLKRIDPVKAGVVYGLSLALISLIVVVPMFLFMSMSGMAAGGNAALGMFGGGFAMLIFVPIFYGILGFIIALIGTALMNFILSKTNGMDMDFESDNLEITQIGKKEKELKY